ncbi:MAG: amidohydrolase [Halobacteriales archaeon]|nr:amidohydrolase [Halobacteriales archaeon]
MNTLSVIGGRVLKEDLTLEFLDVLIDVDGGLILEVGESLRGDEEIDARGGLVIPGLVNSHTHMAMTLLRGYSDDKPLEEWLKEDIWPIESHLTSEDVYIGSQLALVELIKSGTTTFCDMYFHMPEVARATESSGMRAVLGQGVVTVGKNEDDAYLDAEKGLKFAEEYSGFADGRIKTAFMPHSMNTVDLEYFEEHIPRARDLGIPIHLHTNETLEDVEKTIKMHGMRPIELASEYGILSAGDFAAHCVHVDSNEIGILADEGIGVVHCPASNMKLASGIAPIQKLQNEGVTIGLGTDGAASNNDLDLFGEMRDAAMVGKLSAKSASAVNATSVFSMATVGGANILDIPAGRIEPGWVADLAVLDLEAAHLTPMRKCVNLLVYAAKGSDVIHTICDGKVLMKDREILTLDESKVIASARICANDLSERVGKRE